MMRYARNFADEPGLKVPEPLLEASGRRVLTMERVEGVKVTDRDALVAMGVDTFIEAGPKNVLKGLIQKSAPESVRVFNVEDPASLEKTLAELG